MGVGLRVFFLEVLMVEDGAFFFVTAYFAEAVHVELSYEGGEVGVFEVAQEDLVGEAGDVFDDEGFLVVGPADDGEVVGVLSEGAVRR
jgi:hypothetical protein